MESVSMQPIPKVSIIIPSYNNEKYIADAISSALNQTYPNIEVIVVDDNSRDKTQKIVGSFTEDNLYYIKNQSNLGVSIAKNVGIQKCTGDYIAFLDSDDMYEKNKIEEQMNVFNIATLNHQNIGYVYCGIKIVDTYCNMLKEFPASGKAWDGITNGEFVGATPLIKKDCFEKVGLFDPDLKYFEDLDLYFRMKTFGYNFGYTEKTLYLYRQHTTNISKDRQLIVDNVEKYYTKHLSNPELRNNKYILAQFYTNKGVALFLVSPTKSLYFILKSLTLDPKVFIIRFYKLLSNYKK